MECHLGAFICFSRWFDKPFKQIFTVTVRFNFKKELNNKSHSVFNFRKIQINDLKSMFNIFFVEMQVLLIALLPKC